MSTDSWHGFVIGVLFSVGIRELGEYIRCRKASSAKAEDVQ